MTRTRHARPPIPVPETGGRWLLVGLGSVGFALTLLQPAPHYELVGKVAIACAVVLAGACPGPMRARLRRVVVGASGFLATVGAAVWTAYLPEAISLLACSVVLGTISLLFTGPRGRPRHRLG
jgi:hypothetical protein